MNLHVSPNHVSSFRESGWFLRCSDVFKDHESGDSDDRNVVNREYSPRKTSCTCFKPCFESSDDGTKQHVMPSSPGIWLPLSLPWRSSASCWKRNVSAEESDTSNFHDDVSSSFYCRTFIALLRRMNFVMLDAWLTNIRARSILYTR